MTAELFRMDHNDLNPRRSWLGYQSSMTFRSLETGEQATWRIALEMTTQPALGNY
jgi:hypothetical protein